jgi:hypothetical protein
MITKRCLIIDNEDQAAQIENLERLARHKAISLECHQFNIGAPSRTDLLTVGRIDIDLVINSYQATYKNIYFHIVAVDWDLSDESINGVELIRQFEHHKILRNTPKLLYSGLLEHQLRAKLIDYKDGRVLPQKILSEIITLIRSDIVGYVDRTNYENEIVAQLIKREESIDLILEEELRKYPELHFKNSFVSQSFKDKSFSELAELIDNDEHLKNNFKREIIQQVISYLTEKI